MADDDAAHAPEAQPPGTSQSTLSFEEQVQGFSNALLKHLPEDEAKRKVPARVLRTLEDLIRLDAELPNAQRRAAVLRELDIDPRHLEVDEATELLFALRLILLPYADATILFADAEDERRWTHQMTSWLTWDQLFHGSEADIPGLEEYLAGKDVPASDLEGTRRRLMILLRARYDDMLVHRARQVRRRENLKSLSRWLAAVLIVLVPLATIALSKTVPDPPVGLPLGVLAGMLGATLSGTIKARDRLSRSSDIEAFRDGLAAQILVGAAAALVIIVLLGGGLVTIGTLDLTGWQAQVAVGFLAGFSEPFFLGIVGRAATLGAPESAPAAPAT